MTSQYTYLHQYNDVFKYTKNKKSKRFICMWIRERERERLHFRARINKWQQYKKQNNVKNSTSRSVGI